MAGTAFLPGEEWLARLLHPLYVRVRRRQFQRARGASLAVSADWPQAQATVHQIVWDSSLPREQLLYSYSTNDGYFSGSTWRWFERMNACELRVGDSIQVRVNPDNSEESVYVESSTTESAALSASSVVERP
jgi:hypothetical protein